MKKIVLMAAAVLALAACSKETTLEKNNGHAIGFRTSLDTKAVEVSTANLTEFNVTAILNNGEGANYFSGQKFVKNGDFFTSDPVYYWPSGTVKFFAWANANGTLEVNNTAQVVTGFVASTTLANQADFVTAVASGTKAGNEADGVALTFNHNLSQIIIKAKSTSNAYTYSVKGVQIGAVMSKGNFTFDPAGWGILSDAASYSSDLATAVVLNGTAAPIQAVDNFMLVPQALTAWNCKEIGTTECSGSYIAVMVNVATSAGVQIYPYSGDYAYAYVPVGTTWEAGKRYTYVLDFTNGPGKDPEGDDILKPIKFTCTVTDWVDAAQIGVNFQDGGIN